MRLPDFSHEKAFLLLIGFLRPSNVLAPGRSSENSLDSFGKGLTKRVACYGMDVGASQAPKDNASIFRGWHCQK
jgi:hypothetical protein